MTPRSHGPLGLLGDSRPILTRLLEPTLRAALPAWPEVRAAYLGAANGDEAMHFQLFAAAMTAMGVRDTHHVTASAGGASHVERADLIFLAGGDPLIGLRALRSAGLLDLVEARHRAGAVVLGSSAGAMLLGARVWDGHDPATIAAGAKLVPQALGAHAEPGWRELRSLCAHRAGLRGIGLRGGGGAWVTAGVWRPIGSGYDELDA